MRSRSSTERHCAPPWEASRCRRIHWDKQMKKTQLMFVLMLSGVALGAPCALAAETSDDWQFSATVYGWFPDIGGNTHFQSGGGGTIDVDISTILDHLKMTLQGSFEMRK